MTNRYQAFAEWRIGTHLSSNRGRSVRFLRKTRDRSVRVIIQMGLEKSPRIPANGLLLIFGPAATGSPSQDKVAAIRQAFRDTGKDAEPIEGEDVAKIVQRLYSAPPAEVERARQLIPPS